MVEAVTDPQAGMLAHISPAWAILIAGLIAAVTPWSAARKTLMLVAPAVALVSWMGAEWGEYGLVTIGDLTLTTFRYDGLSSIFGLVFIIATFLNGVYSLHERSRVSDAAALIYSGAGLGAVFAGDLITLFIFWELTAMSSVFLVWVMGSSTAINAGLRYLAIHVGSGVLLLAGAVLHFADTGSWAFNSFDPTTLAGALILVAFGIKAAFPLLHNWVQDTYPRASAVGTLVLSIFTTKLAIYALARGFAGFEPLIYIGATMTAFPVFYAVIENDLRKVLSYSLNNQLGFMVAAIGVGTPLALNGAAAHAFTNIIFEGVLFMSMGAVLHRTGTCKASELGGLYKTMPFTAIFCIIGAVSISAFPLFAGFVSKAMIMTAVQQEGHVLVWCVLLFASAGVLEHSGIKIPFFAFFAHDSGKRPKEAPFNMLFAMAVGSFLCIFIGVNYQWLYALLPYQEALYQPYTLDHVLTQMQLLVAAVFAFSFLMRVGIYPPEKPGVNLDFDWFYRRIGLDLARWSLAFWGLMAAHSRAGLAVIAQRIDERMHAVFSPAGALNRAVPHGVLAIWTALLLGVALVVALVAPN